MYGRLQGRGCDRRYTDPQVHSSSSKEGKTSVYGKADLGKAGRTAHCRIRTMSQWDLGIKEFAVLPIPLVVTGHHLIEDIWSIHMTGIESFFRTHTCNAVCQALRLIAPPGFKSGVATQS